MKQFQTGNVQKEYLLVVDGIPRRPIGSEFIVEAPIQQHSTMKFARAIGFEGDGSKHAKTKFIVVDFSPQKNLALLRAFPLTGRTHQIRLHAQHCGSAIVGDTLYNKKE